MYVCLKFRIPIIVISKYTCMNCQTNPMFFVYILLPLSMNFWISPCILSVIVIENSTFTLSAVFQYAMGQYRGDNETIPERYKVPGQ